MKATSQGHPSCLVPYDSREAISLKEAASIAGRSVGTIRNWCEVGIGRKVGGQWRISRIALAMFLDGDQHALRAYLTGERNDRIVVQYFERLMPARRIQNRQ
jgi:hypothetical protein